MNCLPCFSSKEKDIGKTHSKKVQQPVAESPQQDSGAPLPSSSPSPSAQTFTFRELAMATKNFRQECLLGEGGFGRVFKGKLQSSGQVVAVKQLDRNGMTGNKEFLVEVSALSRLHHPNLVNLIGYCADGDQRLLVYEFMPMGSLENHLFGDSPDKKPLDWTKRMKIANGAAKGLEYLHEKTNPPLIYRDLKPSNVILDEEFEPKLSDFGLANLGPGGGKTQPTSRVMGTYGYSAPEYSSGGQLTLKSDMYIFGVLLLELITGRRVIDTTRPIDEQNLVTWAQPIFKDPKRYPEMADPRLNKDFPVTGLNQAVGIAAMCLQEEASVRPFISDVVAALSFIPTGTSNGSIPAPIPDVAAGSEEKPNAFSPPPQQKMDYEQEVGQNSSGHQDRESSDQRDGSCTDSQDEDSDGESMDQENEASSHNSDRETSDQGSGQCSDRESSSDDSDDDSDDRDHYKDAGGSDGEVKDKTDYQDRGGTEAKDVILNSRQPSTKKPQTANAPSQRRNSRTSSTRKQKGSSRHRVVKFKEPGSNIIRSASENFEDGSVSYTDQTKAEARDQSSRSSRGSSIESMDGNGSSHHQADTHKNGSAVDSQENRAHLSHRSGNSGNDLTNHLESDKGNPHLRHLRTR
ncbi:hypothetical protein Ancab_024456 [Ancistrocladus abbreviatus]